LTFDSIVARPRLRQADYQQLLAFRTGLRRFLHWSEAQAAAVGLTPAQHQLLLAIRGHDAAAPPSIGQLAEHLLVRHHSVVGLVDRAAAAGLVERVEDPGDRRVVHIRLTPAGEEALEGLSAAHLEEIRRLAQRLADLAVPPRAGRTSVAEPPAG
jgi:DNA-binding MarR family transcriptional regulator